jgi:glycerol kinase
MPYTLAIDQSTSAPKVLLFMTKIRDSPVCCEHEQYYPVTRWVETRSCEIVVTSIWHQGIAFFGNIQARNRSVALTNQRETVVVWNKETGEAGVQRRGLAMPTGSRLVQQPQAGWTQ